MDHNVRCIDITTKLIGQYTGASAYRLGHETAISITPLMVESFASCQLIADACLVNSYPLQVSEGAGCQKLYQEIDVKVFSNGNTLKVSVDRIGQDMGIALSKIGNEFKACCNVITLEPYITIYGMLYKVKPICSPICSLTSPEKWLWDNGMLLTWDDNTYIFLDT